MAAALGAAEKSKDQLLRDFWGCSIFDFCKNICPKPDSMHCSKKDRYSITFSVWAGSAGGTASPRPLHAK